MSPNNSDDSSSKHLYFLSTTKLTEVSFVYFVNDILDPKKKHFGQYPMKNASQQHAELKWPIRIILYNH